MGDKCGAVCEVYSRVCGYFRPVANWNKGKKEEFRDRKSFRVAAVPAAMALMVALTGGCAAVDAVTASTREKSVAAGSDTWGGGLEAKVATVDCPVPGFECRFGRRKVWYASVRDRATGQAAAEIVRASNSPLSISAGAGGVNAGNDSPGGRSSIRGDSADGYGYGRNAAAGNGNRTGRTVRTAGGARKQRNRAGRF